MEIVKVENLSKVYGNNKNKVVALDNISFSIETGEFVAIIGASGSGKSTLLHILGGVDKPTAGKVLIAGQDINEMNEDELAVFRRKNIGIIYQFYNLLPVLNVEENIMLPGELDNQKVESSKVDTLLNLLDMQERRKHLPNELSGGQQQRVAIGRALINNPAIVLADEPTGNLDTKSSYEIIDLLNESNIQYHQTIVLVTHDLTFASKAGRVITIQDGKIISDERKQSYENSK